MGTLAPIQLRRNTSMYWAGVNPVLRAGEPIYATDSHTLKIGDGGTAYNDLPAFATVADVSDLTESVEQLIAEMVAAGATIEEALEAVSDMQTWLLDIQNQIEANNAETVEAIVADNDATALQIANNNANTANLVDADRIAAQQAKTDAETAANVALAGQFAGTSIPNTGVDANTLRTSGVYKFTGTAAVASTNMPVYGQPGVMQVYDNGNIQRTAQVFLITGSSAQYRRGYYIRYAANINTWDTWQFVSPVRVDSPSGQPGAEFYVFNNLNNVEQQLMPIGINLANSNLDSVTVPGTYFQDNGLFSTSANNYPVTGVGGILEVHKGSAGNYRFQSFVATTGVSRTKGLYQRTTVDGVTWLPWQFMSSLRINNPSGQPGSEFFVFNDTSGGEQQIMPAFTPLGTVNLDVVTVLGSYYGTQGNASTTRNYPVNSGAGLLEVFPGTTTSEIIQRYTIFGGVSGFVRGSYQRRRTGGGVWSSWFFSPSQTVDETAGRAIYTWDDLNQRPQLVYGDTGWRDVSGLLLNGWTGNIHIRRVGSTVSLKFEGLDPATQTSTVPWVVATGFRPSGTFAERFELQHAVVGPSAPIIRRGRVITSGIEIYVPTDAGLLYGTVNYFTSDPWPTTNPGIAVGGIPNA